MSEKMKPVVRDSLPIIAWRLLWVPITILGFFLTTFGVFMMYGKAEGKKIWRQLW